MSRAFHGKIGFGIWFDLDSQRVISMQCRSIIFEVFPSHPHERITNYDRRCLLKSIEECTALRASIEHRSNLKNARKQQQHRTKTTFFLGKKNCDSVCNSDEQWFVYGGEFSWERARQEWKDTEYFSQMNAHVRSRRIRDYCIRIGGIVLRFRVWCSERFLPRDCGCC